MNRLLLRRRLSSFIDALLQLVQTMKYTLLYTPNIEVRKASIIKERPLSTIFVVAFTYFGSQTERLRPFLWLNSMKPHDHHLSAAKPMLKSEDELDQQDNIPFVIIES
jgi:hypothetical protein